LLEYLEPWYWLNWNDDEANKIYWKELMQYLQHTLTRPKKGFVDFNLKTIIDDCVTIRVGIAEGYFHSMYKPTIQLPFGYREIPEQKYTVSATRLSQIWKETYFLLNCETLLFIFP